MIDKKKLLAMFLIFTITFSYFATITEAIAATDFISLFGIKSNAEHENVEFDSVLISGTDEETNMIVSDVNNEELAIKMQLDVINSGYLKNGKVEIKAEENESLNFKLKEDFDISEYLQNVQCIENNIIEFNKIDNSSEKIEIALPIEYENESYISENKLYGTANIVFSGIYVDDDGKENEILKEIPLTIVWKDERSVKVDSEVTKYIQFGNDGVILQTKIKVDSSNEGKNTLPVKEMEVNIDVPTINNKLPKEVRVSANSTEGTNGKSVGEVEFSEDNWNYNLEENKVTIKTENQKQLVKIEDEDNFLKAEENQIEEERYYNGNGIDEYIVTYTYREIEKEESIETSSRIEAILTTFSGVKVDKFSNVIAGETTSEYILEGETGKIVSYAVKNETKEVSKVYAYLNKEVEYNSKTAINISYKDIVEEINVKDTENYYIDKNGEYVKADDIYYKEVSISKDNFINILGEDGNIQLLNSSDEVIAEINNNTAVDENGNYILVFQDRISKIGFKISAPINEGDLIISNKKAISSISLSKQDYANVEYLATSTQEFLKLNYVSDLVDGGNCTIKTKLNDTKTDFNLVVDRDSLSTITTNSNVEMRLELNNDEETSDTYGNSVFEIEMPESVTGLTVTSASMIYGEGLEISNVETYLRETDGRAIIKVAVSGEQNELNSGVLTNGANIVLNADLNVDKYTPSKETEIKAYCYNSEATNYENAIEHPIEASTICSAEEAKIEYSAPSGMISINTLSNYNSVGSELTSVKQGKKEDYIDIYSEAKVAKMEIVAINNDEKEASDLSVLGRIPFKGVQDITTGEELGTTLDTKMISQIISDENNNEEFIVYYSENENATKELNDLSNGWKTNIQDFSSVKSYLIVPANTQYKMQPEQVLKFTYEYEIPENLQHNEKIYGTFATYYKINEELENEVSKPDLIGLTTGEGPKLEVEIRSTEKKVKELDEFEIKSVIRNSGNDIANDVITNIEIPSNTTFVSAEADKDTTTVEYVENKVVANIGRLEKDKTVEITLKLKVNNINEADSDEIVVVTKTSAKDLEKELVKKFNDVKIKRSELRLEQEVDHLLATEYFEKGNSLDVILFAQNLTNDKLSDVTVETVLPKELEFVNAYMIEGSSEKGIKQIENATYNKDTNKVIWKINEIDADSGKTLRLELTVGDLDYGVTGKETVIKSMIFANGTEAYNGNDIAVNIGKSSLEILQTSETPTYIEEGEIIKYTFTIKNVGMVQAQNVLLSDIIPEGVTVNSISYSVNDELVSNNMSETEVAEIELTVPANTEIDVNVNAIATELDGVQEKTVTNEGKVSANGIDEIKSNSITHIIKAKEDDESMSETIIDSVNTGDITKSYKVTGTAWEDTNKNGMRDNEEKRLEGVTAILVDSASGVIKSTTQTNNNGEYAFTGIQKGSYLVLFKYDTVKYTTTTYKQEGVDTSVNSDVVTTKIDQDGKKENGAVTDVININGANVLNVDIGLVEAAKFSLQLDKSISKVTVQNSQETKTEEFEKTKLAKYDIAAKYLSGTTVYVEYELTVTNNGDLSGFASEIVDYIPKGMTFNSKLNPDWYTGTDGSLYTKALANTELAKGESKSIRLVLTKQMTAENTGIVSNTAEISDDFNIYGISDFNSKPMNKAQGEDDMSTADTILTVKTGESLIYISAIIISAIIGCAVAFVVYEKVLKSKQKGGV